MEHARLLVDGHAVAELEVARSMADRSKGLLGRDALIGALWLEPCRSVHTLRMRFRIDVAHVAEDGRVLSTVTMAPWRMGAFRWRARAVVEAAAR
jgi:uncharacterized membrane protein (UPF0127 family)